MSIELKFGHISGGKSSFPLPMGASEVIRGQSGRFVDADNTPTTRYGEIAGAAHTRIMGFVEGGDETMNSAEGGSILNCIDDLTAIFRVPLRYATISYATNYSVASLGNKAALVVVNNIQYVELVDTSNRELVIIVGGKAASAVVAAGAVADRLLGDGYVDVRINPSKLHISDT